MGLRGVEEFPSPILSALMLYPALSSKAFAWPVRIKPPSPISAFLRVAGTSA
jgi:hypothetical protein